MMGRIIIGKGWCKFGVKFQVPSLSQVGNNVTNFTENNRK
jgi:hypothetical protein